MTPVIWPSIVTAIVILLVIATVLTRRLPDGLQPRLLLVQLFTLAIAVGDTGFELTDRASWSTFWLSVIHTGAIGLAVSWWLLIAQLSRSLGIRIPGPAFDRAVAACGASIWLLMATNPLHGQFVTLQVNSRSIYHWGFWLHTAFSYSAVVATVGLLFRMNRRATSRRERTQVQILLVAPATVVLGNLIYLLWPSALPIDPTVLAVGFSGLLFAAGMYWTQLFDPAPAVLQEVLSRSSDGILMMGRDRGLEWANAAACQMLGGDFGHAQLARGAEVSLLLAGFLGRDAAGEPMSLGRLRGLLAAREPRELLVGARGGGKSYRLSVEPVRTQRGRVMVRSISLHDATVQVEAERVLRRGSEELEALVAERTRALTRANDEKDTALDALARSEARYRALVDDAPLGVVACDRDGRLMASNAHLWAVLRMPPPDDLEGLNAWSDQTLQRAGVADVLWRCLESARRQREDAAYFGPAGEAIHLRIHAAPLIDRDEKVDFAQAIVEDVTDQVEAGDAMERDRDQLARVVLEQNEALERSRDRLLKAQRLSAVGTLVAGIGHQINNPIGAIMASAEFALTCEGDPDQLDVWRRALRENVEQAARCGEVVKDLLRLSRSEPTSMSPGDLGEVVQRAVYATRGYAAERGGVVDVSLPDALPVVMSAIQIEQVLVNVLRNALESKPSGVHVRVHGRAGDGWIRLVVEDDGGGIDAEALDHVFDPLFTTRLDEGGSGLGLSVAHGIVLVHGGVMRAHSEPGRGTTIEIDLPLVER